MCAPSLVRGHAVIDHRREQWVREANRPAGALDHAGGDGWLERAVGDVQQREQFERRTPYGRCEQQRISSRRRQLFEACAHQSLERLREAKRLRGVDLGAQSPRQLERVEGVPTDVSCTRRRVGRASGVAEVFLEQLVSGPEAERADL